jgi:hypothetical protein
MPCAGGVESRRRREEQVPQPLARSQSSTHSLRCSSGGTALKYATYINNADAAAYLRSIGAPEWRRPAPPTVNAMCFLLELPLPPAAMRSGCGRWVLMTTGSTGSEMRRVALMWPSLAAMTTSRDQVRRHAARGRQQRNLSLYLKE